MISDYYEGDIVPITDQWHDVLARRTSGLDGVHSVCKRNFQSVSFNSSAVWDPYSQELIQKVGKIQRRAVRMIHKNYNWKASVTELTRDLDLDMLSTRRKISRLCILQKATGGQLALPVQNYLHPTQRQTRRSHSGAFIEYQTRIVIFKYSYIPRTIIDWNNLPPNISNIWPRPV